MNIYFAVPAYRGIQSLPFVDALEKTFALCKERGIGHALAVLSGCCYVQVARNELVKGFRESNADVLFFLDDDVSWEPEDVIRLAEMPDDMVAGVYRFKYERENYPVVIHTDERGIPITREDGCIAAACVATGFLSVKRAAIERMCEAYPARTYFKRDEEKLIKGYYDLFPQGLRDGQWVGEDYAFCRLWTDIGGTIWVVPDLNLTHHSATQGFTGNYHKYLMAQPGGCNSTTAKAAKVEGWMSLEELGWLARQAQKHDRIVEVGSWMGRSTRAIADNTPGTVYAVDTWQGSDEHADIMRTISPDQLFDTFLENTKGLSNIVAVRRPSLEAADAMKDEMFDMVFIDGDHSYEEVKKDICAWKERLAPDGLLCGHDYNWPGVKQAVSELLPNAVQVPGTAIWVTA